MNLTDSCFTNMTCKWKRQAELKLLKASCSGVNPPKKVQEKGPKKSQKANIRSSND